MNVSFSSANVASPSARTTPTSARDRGAAESVETSGASILIVLALRTKKEMKRPAARIDFLNAGDELNYLSDFVRYFASKGASNSAEAAPFLQRFSDLLQQSGSDDGSILLQDHWALLHEIKGDIPKAIEHREREVELIERLFAIGGPIGSVDYSFLAEVMDVLLSHYVRQEAGAEAAALRVRIGQVRERAQETLRGRIRR
jgi:hypothetical protein